MKKCPQCNNVFPDSLVYCTHDGTPLAEENLTMPSDFSAADAEEDTVIRREPITIDFSGQNASSEQFGYQPVPPVENAAPVIVVKQRNTGKYLLFLIIGLIFGGVLVLATLLLARNYYQSNAAVKITNTNAASVKTSNINIVNRETKTLTPTATPLIEPLNSEHQTKTDEDDSEFNGRVISANAYVRSEPSKTASQVDILPVNDRLHIKRRENDSSPWFYVTCEHGTSGWMHGNTIEYTE